MSTLQFQPSVMILRRTEFMAMVNWEISAEFLEEKSVVPQQLYLTRMPVAQQEVDLARGGKSIIEGDPKLMKDWYIWSVIIRDKYFKLGDFDKF